MGLGEPRFVVMLLTLELSRIEACPTYINSGAPTIGRVLMQINTAAQADRIIRYESAHRRIVVPVPVVREPSFLV